jgi:hypothetical protein
VFARRWLLSLLLVTGCPDERDDDPRDTGVADTGAADTGSRDAGPDGGVMLPDAGECGDVGPRANVRFLGDRRIERRFTDVLGLDRTELCNELGLYNCVDIHRVAIGGVDPYALGLYEKLPDSTATAPLAVERLAFHGCRVRVDRDLGNAAQALIFTSDRAASIERLYRRALSRDPNADEIAALELFHGEVLASGEPNPERSFAILSCTMVLTSVESLFY